MSMIRVGQGKMQKPQNSNDSDQFFVCQNIPFVGSKSMTIKPFIGLNHPFVRFGGFTLIELIVTLVVVGILMTVAVPQMRTILQDNRLASHSNDLIADLSFARSEAVKRAANVGICPTTSGTNCEGISWNTGRIVYSINNGVRTVLRYREALTTNTLTSATVPATLEFNSRGIPLGLPAAATFSLCDSRGSAKGRSIAISAGGQATVRSTPPSGC